MVGEERLNCLRPERHPQPRITQEHAMPDLTFQTELKKPCVYRVPHDPTGVARLRVCMRNHSEKLADDLPPTDLWVYTVTGEDGTVLINPTIEVRRGQRVAVE